MIKSNFYKILLIGDSKVGKSSLILRYIDDTFSSNFLTTIGVDFKTKKLNIDNDEVKLQVWDTAGQEKFRAITQSYYRRSNGVILVFDLSERSSFESVPDWIESVKSKCDKSIIMILVGNKCDLNRSVSKNEAEELASRYNLSYFETSAKDNTNVEEAFQYLANLIYNNRDTIFQQQGNNDEEEVKINNEQKEEKKGCC